MKHLCKLLLLISISVSASNSLAALYEGDFNNIGSEYLRSLGRLKTDSVERLSGDQKSRCENRYGKILNDGVIDIRIIMGYFDWTTGSQINKDGRNYGFSPSIDPGAYGAIRRMMTGRCPGDAQFCGFKQDGDAYHYSKNVTIQGKTYQAKITMTYASVSEYLDANNGKYKSEQETRSAASQSQFNAALQNADAVFYFGHSRNGGGPDFNPPVFISGMNKVNYNGYYKPNRPGLKKMLAALQAGSKKPSFIGLMSCDSRDHFLGSIRSAAPNTGLISSTNVLRVDGVYTAMIGGVDAILRGQCQSGFMNSIRMTDFNRQNITMDGMF